jgi:thiol-disulfide isomerase/thioredoxin
MSQGVWVLVVVLLAATGFGLFRAARDGRFRGTHAIRPRMVEPADRVVEPVETTAPGSAPVEPSVLDGSDLDHELGERATLLQFSSAFCAPCRATRRVLADVASVVPGVEHVEIDAEHHLDLVRRLGVLRTPTTLILDHGGREVSRAAGAPTKEAVLATLARTLAT